MDVQRKIAMLAIASAALTASARASSLGPSFISLYTIANLGVPSDLPPYGAGGIAFSQSNPSVLLMGGISDYVSGSVYSVGLTRDPVTNEVTGYSGAFSSYASATYIDGGLTYGPDGYLFFTQYPNNTISEMKPGSTSPDFTESLPGVTSSVGGLNFIPAGFSGAGNAAITSYNGDSICSSAVTLNGDGSYSFGACTDTVALPSVPEGIQYIAAGTPGFSANSILVSFYSQGLIEAYQVDANGMPILATGKVFASGVGNPIGITVDPLTGAILSDSISGSITVVMPDVVVAPEPGSFWLAITAAIAAAGFRRRRE
jgi:hypothetical protein